MAAADNRYSVFVGWAKITLPLVALALLSTLFLLSRRDEPGVESLPLSRIAALAQTPGITAPTLAGLAEDGSRVSLRAAELRPVAGNPDSFSLTGAELALTAPDGTRLDLSAGSGRIDGAGRIAVFGDGVELTTSTGFSVTAPGLRADLRAATVDSGGRVTATAPFGRLEAARLHVSADPEGRSTRLLFDGGVRLLYNPQP
jgi:lipopolysaccharide export system protein LptC